MTLQMFHTGAIAGDGVYVWGGNKCGKLGNGTDSSCTIPQKANIQ